jgi:hypothetical protein
VPSKLAPPRKRKQRGEKGGTREGSLNKRTIEAQILGEIENARAKGRVMHVHRLQQYGDFVAGLIAQCAPKYEEVEVLDKATRTKRREFRLVKGDPELFFRLLPLGIQIAGTGAQYQSPKLAAVQMIPPGFGADQDGKPRQTNVSVTIFNAKGDVEWSSAPKQIEGKVVP